MRIKGYLINAALFSAVPQGFSADNEPPEPPPSSGTSIETLDGLVLMTNKVATVSKENPMKNLYALLALILAVGFAVPASAVDLSNVKSQAACEAAGGVWDREADGCVAKESQRACELRNGTWDEGSSTCTVPQ
jgi:hypothetical protein